MIRLLKTLCLLVITNITSGQSLYLKSFGDPTSKPVIFLHGGPGYNSAAFEITTAQRLADSGYFVIVYDRRGEGRSKDSNASYTFAETFNDLNNIYEKYSITRASLIGHSFGGMAAVLFAEKYPGKVSNLFLVGAPVSLQETYRNIISRSKDIYIKKKDSINLNYINMLQAIDTASLDYSTYCFGHAMQNGFYSPKKLSDEAKQIYKRMQKDSLVKFTYQMTTVPPSKFWKNEHYTTLDLTTTINSLIKKKVSIHGIYGKEDGLYSEQQTSKLATMLGESNFLYLENCSHSVFIDQQTLFIESVAKWTR
ncbi:MAG: alpha/beta hydrolase [Ferruginibacter sp.]|nr:alpha/beta hydrolase [Ferruginibacter sp.]